jgi:hypothetical protein
MKWTDELVREEILKSKDRLALDRMPTANELKAIGRNDLHCKISRTKKYSGWADDLGLELSRCETRLGNNYELTVAKELESMGFKIEQMTTKHPYDILVDGYVKVDVKASNLFKHTNGQEWWTFHLAKENPTCDIYICVALVEGNKVKTFVIPSHLVKMKSINVGKSSKYNRFEDAYNYIDEYSIFFRSIN